MATIDSTATPRAKTGYGQILGIFLAVVCEYRRAVAAEEYYRTLKEKSSSTLARQGICRNDIPRRVFERFYWLQD